MTWIDCTIVYLACGAPLGVYYFLLHRTRAESFRLWLKSFLTFVFWMPFAFQIVREHKIFDAGYSGLNSKEQDIQIAQKQIEKHLLESVSKISLFEFRETLERYVGLTLADRRDAIKVSEQEREIFRAAEIKNVALAAACLERRNRKRLSFHQSEARRDFLQLIERLFASSESREKLHQTVIEFVVIMNDLAAREKLEKLFAGRLQTAEARPVEQTEKVLWKSEIRKPLRARSISTRL